MDSTDQQGRSGISSPLTLPHRTLLALCGPAGCGKSTFAKRLVDSHKTLQTTMIVSSDYCRALVCDDETNQQVNRDTFDLFHYIINKRMFQQRFTIADSTALQPDARYRLLDLAQRHHYSTCLVVFDVPIITCLQHDRQRHRTVGAAVITYHIGLLQQVLINAPNEGWSQVIVLQESQIDAGLHLVLS